MIHVQPSIRSLVFDGSYEGLLTAVFESYRLKISRTLFITQDDWNGSLFEEPLMIETDQAKSDRVIAGILKKCGKKGVELLYRTFLSEAAEVPHLIAKFIKDAMASDLNIVENYGDDTVLRLHQLNKKIGREVHRMHAFVRFQRTRDDIYYAVIEPDFNVLPLLPAHFENRYPAQRWLIYDAKRRYGIHYDLNKVEFITFADDHRMSLRQLSRDLVDDAEPNYQVLWKSYFDSVNIPERRNMKLHLQHVPKRYWKYLSEKG